MKKIVGDKERQIMFQLRTLRWNRPLGVMADRWELLPSVSIAHSQALLTMRIAWLFVELDCTIITFHRVKYEQEEV